MPQSSQPFPNFDRPPVIETVLGLQFPARPGWNLPQMGAYWGEVRSRYPKTEIHPTLANLPGGDTPETGPQLTLRLEPDARFWLVGADETELVQLQRNRFIQNWRAAEGCDYPRYEVLSKRFLDRWRHLVDFWEQTGIEPPTELRCEVTYINHIDQGSGWSTFADLPEVFPCLSNQRTTGFLPDPESIGLTRSYSMPDGARLRAEVRPVVRATDQMKTLQFTLSAIGDAASAATEDVQKWLNFGREWVVKGFVDLTSEKLHAKWGLQ